MIRSRLRFAAAVLLLAGCQSARAGTVPPADDDAAHPSFYCERSYTNHAWGYVHLGVFVDGEGGVYRYAHGPADRVLLQVHADSLTEQRLLAKYAPGRTRVGAVQPAEVARRHAQALEARGGTVSRYVERSADMGDTVRRCYLPDAAGVYREVVLRQTGDLERENRSPAAAEVSVWLDSLASTVR